MKESGSPTPSNPRTALERFNMLVGVIGAIVTIILTTWNVHTKDRIDQKEEDLKSTEVRIKERSAVVEESKERVERYKWVFALLNTISDNEDTTKRSFTVSLMRLALTKDEAQELFSGFKYSSAPELRKIGEQGFELDRRLRPIAELQQTIDALCRRFGEIEAQRFEQLCTSKKGVFDLNTKECVTKDGTVLTYQALCPPTTQSITEK